MTNIQRDIFPNRGGSSASPQNALPVIDQTSSQFTTQTFTAGTDFTVPAGSQSQECRIQLKFAPVMGNYGRTGSFNNSSLSFGGALATTFTTEVAFVADTGSLGGKTTNLTDGQYMVDYEAGIVYGKRADSNTAGTVTYSYWAKGSVSGTGSSASQTQGNVANDGVDSGNPVKVGGVYNSTKPTVASGDRVDWQMTNRGEGQVVEQNAAVAEDNTIGVIWTHDRGTSSSTNANSRDTSTALESSSVIKAGAGRLYEIDYVNTSGSTVYFQVFNSTTVPIDTTVPSLSFYVPAGQSLQRSYPKGKYFSTGAVWATSSTAGTKTLTAASGLADVEYS